MARLIYLCSYTQIVNDVPLWNPFSERWCFFDLFFTLTGRTFTLVCEAVIWIDVTFTKKKSDKIDNRLYKGAVTNIHTILGCVWGGGGNSIVNSSGKWERAVLGRGVKLLFRRHDIWLQYYRFNRYKVLKFFTEWWMNRMQYGVYCIKYTMWMLTGMVVISIY